MGDVVELRADGQRLDPANGCAVVLVACGFTLAFLPALVFGVVFAYRLAMSIIP